MKVLKVIGLVLLIILVLFLIIALFLPSEYRVQRSAEIMVTPDSLYAVLSDYNYFAKWNPWIPMEPEASVEIAGSPGTVGTSYSWSGKIIGTGKLVVTNMTPPSSIQQRIHFIEPMESQADLEWRLEPTSGGTKLVWTMRGPNDYPMGRYFGLLMDDMMGKDFESGLANLKKLCESPADSSK